MEWTVETIKDGELYLLTMRMPDFHRILPFTSVIVMTAFCARMGVKPRFILPEYS